MISFKHFSKSLLGCAFVATMFATPAAAEMQQKVSLGVTGGYQHLRFKNKTTMEATGRPADSVFPGDKNKSHGARAGAAFLYDLVWESISVGFGLDAGYAFGKDKTRNAAGIENTFKPGFYSAATVRLALPAEHYGLEGFTPYVRFGLAVAQFKNSYKNSATGVSKDYKKWKLGPTAGLGVCKDVGPCAIQLGYDFSYYGKMENKFEIPVGGSALNINLKKERIVAHVVSLGVMFNL